MGSKLSIVLALLLAAGAQAQGQPGGYGNQLMPAGTPPAPSGAGGKGAPSRAQVRQLFARAQALHMSAGVARRKGDLASAVKDLKAIVAMPFPDDQASRKLLGSVYLNLADLLQSQGKWQDADVAARQGRARLDHASVPPSYHLAELFKLHSKVLDQLGRRDEAEAALARCLAIYKQLDSQ